MQNRFLRANMWTYPAIGKNGFKELLQTIPCCEHVPITATEGIAVFGELWQTRSTNCLESCNSEARICVLKS